MGKQLTPEEQKAKTAAEAAAFSARLKGNATTAKPLSQQIGEAFQRNAERIAASRAQVLAVMEVTEDAVQHPSETLTDWTRLGEAVQGEIFKHQQAASTQNLKGGERYKKKIRIVLTVEVS